MNVLIKRALLSTLLCVSQPAPAAPATRLVVNCVPSTIPPPAGQCFNHVAGQPFNFWVVAVDSNFQLATGYTGTVHIASSDPSATLPADHVFTASDNSIVAFSFTFNSVTGASIPSPETITASDASNGMSGRREFNIFLPIRTVSLPSSSPLSMLLLTMLLAFAGLQSFRRWV